LKVIRYQLEIPENYFFRRPAVFNGFRSTFLPGYDNFINYVAGGVCARPATPQAGILKT